MRNLSPEEIRRAVHGRWRWPAKPLGPLSGAATVTGVSTDSRQVSDGRLFVAIAGPTFDGHDFLADAARAGCVSAVVSQEAAIAPEVMEAFGGGVIGVADTVEALGLLAGHVRSQMSTTVVAVTGSVGKTTVKGMIHAILSRRLRGRASPKSFNNAIGVPLTIFSAEPEDDYIVCEVGTNAPGEIAALARIVRPDLAVITGIAEVHLEKLIDLSHIAGEKAALLGEMPPTGRAVVWADSEELDRAVKAYEGRLIRFGANVRADLRLTGYEPVGAAGGRFQVNGRLWVELKVPGRHNAMNALAAMAVAQRFGFTPEEAGEALAEFAGADMRLQVVQAGTVTIINDAYNANPSSIAAAAEVLASHQGRRTVLVAGDMLELGERSVELHQRTGRRIAEAGIDVVIGVGALGREIAAGAGESGAAAVRQFDSVDEAIAALPKTIQAGDVVLVKGSRGMKMERLIPAIEAAAGEAPKAARASRKAGS